MTSTPFHPKQEPKGNGMCDDIMKAIEGIMEQAQVFASTYSLAGGRFDDGTKFEQSKLEKDDLRDLIALAIQAERNKDRWNSDMDAAPKDETDILVYCADTGEQFTAYRHAGNKVFVYALSASGQMIGCAPTHWQFLPAPPAAITEGEG